MHSCPICKSNAPLYDVVDFHRTTEDAYGKPLELTCMGVPVYYAKCVNCDFCFAPELIAQSMEWFKENIYNDGYLAVDPHYESERPQAYVNVVRNLFPAFSPNLTHLDYGGGNGYLAKHTGWNSKSYDVLIDAELPENKFNFITAFEVFEHVSDPHKIMQDLHHLLSKKGVIIFSTSLSDGHIVEKKRLDWWYVAPRNGHISLFSRNSLFWLAKAYGFNMASFQHSPDSLHMFYTEAPSWAQHLVPRS